MRRAAGRSNAYCVDDRFCARRENEEAKRVPFSRKENEMRDHSLAGIPARDKLETIVRLSLHRSRASRFASLRSAIAVR